MAEDNSKTLKWLAFATALITAIGAAIGLAVGLTQNKGEDANTESTPSIDTNSTDNTTAKATVPDLYSSGSPIGEGTYYLRSIYTGYSIGWNATMTRVIHTGANSTGEDYEKWTIRNAGGGRVRIKAEGAGQFVSPTPGDPGITQLSSIGNDNEGYLWKFVDYKFEGGLAQYEIMGAEGGTGECWSVYNHITSLIVINLFTCNDGPWQLYSVEPIGMGVQAGIYTIQLLSSSQASTPLSMSVDGSNGIIYSSIPRDTWQILPVDTDRLWIRHLHSDRWLTYSMASNPQRAMLGGNPADLRLREVGKNVLICQAANITLCLDGGSEMDVSFVPTQENGTMTQLHQFKLDA